MPWKLDDRKCIRPMQSWFCKNRGIGACLLSLRPPRTCPKLSYERTVAEGTSV